MTRKADPVTPLTEPCSYCWHPAHPFATCHEHMGGDPSNGPNYCPCTAQMEAMEGEIGRLRRTLDAARQSDGAEAGLRAALARWEREADRRESAVPSKGGHEAASLLASGVLRRCADDVRAALQAAPVSIDRERLAKALIVWGGVAHEIGLMSFSNEARDAASAIIREYDRPSHPDPVSGPSRAEKIEAYRVREGDANAVLPTRRVDGSVRVSGPSWDTETRRTPRAR